MPALAILALLRRSQKAEERGEPMTWELLVALLVTAIGAGALAVVAMTIRYWQRWDRGE